MSKNTYKKLNESPIEIEYIPDEALEEETEPSFLFQGTRYLISNFIRTHNNPWFVANVPDFIHAIQADEIYAPLCLELIGDSEVNVYQEV